MTTLPFEQKPIYLYASGVINSDIPTDPVDGSFLDFVAVIDDCQTIRFKHGWYQPGDFELTINKNTNYAAEFQRKRIIQIGTDTSKCGVIESVENKVGPDGALSELITVKGRELTSYLDRRIVSPGAGQAYYALPSTTPVETVIKTILDISMGPSASANRKVSTLVIEADTAAGDDYVLSARYDNLLILVGNACLATSSGVFVYLDHTAKTWVFGFSLGVNRTDGQSTNSKAIFSTDRETVLTATLKDVDTGYKNWAAVGGQGEGANRTIVTVPSIEPTGIDRREMFVDARDLSATASLQNRGLQKLAENQFVKFLSSDVLAYSQLIYGQDYNVGDQITIIQFGQTQDAFITSAEEYWSNGTYNLTVGFDKSSPTLPSQVSGSLAQIQKTLNSIELPPGLPWTSETGPIYPSELTLLQRFCFNGLPVLPDIPDDLNGTSYLQDAWLTTDSWTGNSGTTVVVNNGVLQITFGGTVSSSAFYANRNGLPSFTPANTFIFLCRVRRISGTATSVRMYNVAAGATICTGTYTESTGNWQIVPMPPSSAWLAFGGSGTTLRFFVNGALNGDQWELDWLYTGNGNFVYFDKDTSTNNNELSIRGNTSRSIGFSGYALSFSGKSSFAIGAVTGLSTSITVSFRIKIPSLVATGAIRNIFSTSTDVSSTPGAIKIYLDASVDGRLWFQYHLASLDVLGSYDVSETSWFHISMSVDTTDITDDAILVRINGILIQLSYSTSTAADRPSLYNGSFYLAAKGGTTLFSQFDIDDLQIDSSLLSSQAILALATMVDPESSGQTGTGSLVRSDSPIFTTKVQSPAILTSQDIAIITIPSGYQAFYHGAVVINKLTLEGTGKIIVL